MTFAEVPERWITSLELRDLGIRARSVAEIMKLPPGVQDLNWYFKCPNPECTESPTAYRTRDQAIRFVGIHNEKVCPVQVKRRKPVADTPISNMWKRLDEITETVMSTPKAERDTEDFLRAAGQATGIAFSIWAIVGKIRYETPRDVSKAALHRRKARLGEVEYQGTPGLLPADDALADLLKYEKKESKKNPPASRATPTPRKKKNEVDPPADSIEAIKRGVKAGLPARSLAKAYGVSESKINEIASSAQ